MQRISSKFQVPSSIVAGFEIYLIFFFTVRRWIIIAVKSCDPSKLAQMERIMRVNDKLSANSARGGSELCR